MNAVVMVDRNWSIGSKKHGQTVTNKQDMKHFKSLTEGGTVIMGRRTYECLPEKYRPLPNRRNIILSSTLLTVPGAEVYSTVGDVVQVAPYNSFVIGGASIYQQFMPYCDLLYVTMIDDIFYDVCSNDTIMFPDFLEMISAFEMINDVVDQVDPKVRYVTYARRK